MTETRKHPDLFTPDEAVEYLHLDSERGLETCRKEFGLPAYSGINKSYLYHREDLDACAPRMCGRDRAWELSRRRQDWQDKNVKKEGY